MLSSFISIYRDSHTKAIFLVLLPTLLLFSRALADATVILTGAIFLFLSYRNSNWKWLTQPWFLLSLLLVSYLVLVSAPLGYNFKESALYSLAYLRWPIFTAALAVWIFKERESVVLFGTALLVTLLFVMFDSFWQFFTGVDLFGIEKFNPQRLTGPMRNPVVGNISLRLFFIALFVLTLHSTLPALGKRISLMLSFLLLFLLFSFSTGERMSFLLTLCSCGIVIIGLFAEYPRYRKWLLLWAAASITAFVVFAIIYPTTFNRSVIQMIDSLSNFSNDPYGRVFVSGIKIWLQHPFTGIGISNYPEYCDEFIRIAKYNACQRHPHNIYILWLAEAGGIGTLLFITSIAVFTKQILTPLFRYKRWLLSSCIIASLFITFWPLASSSSFFNNWLGALVWCNLGWALALSQNHLNFSTSATAQPQKDN